MVMAVLAQRLPVAPIPEQNRIAAMRNDMVNDCSCHDLSLLLASDTQRMGIEENPSGFLPPPVVSLFFCCFCIMVMELDVFLTVEPTIRNCPPTTRMLSPKQLSYIEAQDIPDLFNIQNLPVTVPRLSNH